MKRIFFLIFFVIIASCRKNSSDNPDNRFSLNGSIERGLEGRKVFLKTQERGILTTLDSTVIREGGFKFEGQINKPGIFGIFIENTEDAIGIFMENTEIGIRAYKDSLSKSKISGSKTNDAYLDFVERSKRITSKMNSLFPVFQKARAENDVEKLEEINSKMRAINHENALFSLKYAKENPNSYIAAYALYSILNVPSIEQDSLRSAYDNLSDYVKSGDFALETSQFLSKEPVKDSILN